VVAFVIGLPEWTDKRTESAFTELASSFDEYVAKLRIDRVDVVNTLVHDATDMSHVEATGRVAGRRHAALVTILSEARRRLALHSRGVEATSAFFEVN
jgi:hypothetical protein